MRLLGRRQTKPLSRHASVVHVLLTLALPVLLYILVTLDFSGIAFALILLSKWRMFSVKMRHWPANIRVNAVDIFVGLSVVSFMSIADASSIRLLWAVLYAGWLLGIKPRSNPLSIGLQALIAQTVSLIAIFLIWNSASEIVLAFAVWGVTYLSSRHFLGAFDEPIARGTAYVWAFLCASLTWLMSHWLLFYGAISQPALIITVIAYGIGALYYLQHTERLKPAIRRQFVGLIITALLFIIIFSDWSGDII